VNDEITIATPADPDDPDDFPITVAAWKRAVVGRSIRQLRNRLGLTQQEFAEAYGIPAANIRQYEMGRHMPPPAVRAYFKAISSQPEAVRQALHEKTALAFDIPDVEAA
jgi:putative transcriptional regulator